METGDADTMGQAWQAVKTGSVQPDIDSLNTLLKCVPYSVQLQTEPSCYNVNMHGLHSTHQCEEVPPGKGVVCMVKH